MSRRHVATPNTARQHEQGWLVNSNGMVSGSLVKLRSTDCIEL